MEAKRDELCKNSKIQKGSFVVKKNPVTWLWDSVLHRPSFLYASLWHFFFLSLPARSAGFPAPSISILFPLLQPQKKRLRGVWPHIISLSLFIWPIPQAHTHRSQPLPPFRHQLRLSFVRNAARELGEYRWASGIRGGQEETGWSVPAATSSPRLNTSYYLPCTHPSLLSAAHK